MTSTKEGEFECDISLSGCHHRSLSHKYGCNKKDKECAIRNASLREHPKKCPQCNTEGSVTFERLSCERGEYVCEECGWSMNALTGAVTKGAQ